VIATNVPVSEHEPLSIQKAELESIMQGVSYRTFEDTSTTSTASEEREIWKLFLAGVLFFLIAEALLCLPKPLKDSPTLANQKPKAI
jgi:hypothetical protein